jgi:hypothetical protein
VRCKTRLLGVAIDAIPQRTNVVKLPLFRQQGWTFSTL